MAATVENVNYASVVFKANKHSSPEAKKVEETVYNEVKVQSETTEQSDVSAGFLSNKKANYRRHHRASWCLGILCVMLLLGIIAVCVYFTVSPKSEQSQLKENQTLLLGFSHNLTNLNHKLSSENENLRRDHDNLMGQLDTLTQASTASQGQITNLRTENQQLERQNQELKTENQALGRQNQQLERQNQELKTEYQALGRQNQQLERQNQQLERQNQEMKTQNELETERNTFTKTREDLETMWNMFVVHRAQWIIDAYCPKKDGERQPCQRGWTFFHSSCYDIHSAEWRSWDEAQTSCKRQNSDLVVVVNEQEKTFIRSKSLDSSDTSGYWIGLRVEDGKWKWVDGSDLTESSWIHPPADGHCAISVRNAGWRSVSCATTNHWICKQKALD
ncbi:uncharacterized protein LOC143324740 [Chaetodon auriga]|uniref:uncharacterized protein LOC143324740 n=1 Tax=Chaetodon auriga TaxID=39042 RepID=UPI0040329F8C